MLLPWPLPQSWDTLHPQHLVHAGYAGPRMDNMGHRQEDSFPPAQPDEFCQPLCSTAHRHGFASAQTLLKKPHLYS